MRLEDKSTNKIRISDRCTGTRLKFTCWSGERAKDAFRMLFGRVCGGADTRRTQLCTLVCPPWDGGLSTSAARCSLSSPDGRRSWRWQEVLTDVKGEGHEGKQQIRVPVQAVRGKCQTVWRDQSWRGEKVRNKKLLTEQPEFIEGLLVDTLYVLTKTIRRTRTKTKHSFLRLIHKCDIYISSIFWFSAPRRRLRGEQTFHRFQRPIKENRLQNGLPAQCVFSSHISLESRAFFLSQILWTVSYFSWNP